LNPRLIACRIILPARTVDPIHCRVITSPMCLLLDKYGSKLGLLGSQQNSRDESWLIRHTIQGGICIAQALFSN
ncbi:hypothetical protein WAJ73_22780, partial [Acinetobacter baumannii]